MVESILTELQLELNRNSTVSLVRRHAGGNPLVGISTESIHVQSAIEKGVGVSACRCA